MKTEEENSRKRKAKMGGGVVADLHLLLIAPADKKVFLQKGSASERQCHTLDTQRRQTASFQIVSHLVESYSSVWFVGFASENEEMAAGKSMQ